MVIGGLVFYICIARSGGELGAELGGAVEYSTIVEGFLCEWMCIQR